MSQPRGRLDAVPRFDPVLGERIARHGFAGRPAQDVGAAAGMVCGIQAQDSAAARLGVRARSAATTDAGVQAALDHREVVRTWLMRNTIHLVPARDVRWMSALLGPMIRRRFETVRWPQLDLTPDLLERAAGLAPQVLAGQALTRHEFAAALREQGVVLGDDPQAATHLLLYLSTLGLTCRGVDRGREATFVLVDDWLPGTPPGPRGDDALAELARRYFAAFSPATPADFTTWSGLASGRAVELIRDELDEADVHGRAGFRLGTAEPARGLRLLAAFDNYLVGYKDRSPLIDAGRRPQVYVGGVIRPTVLVDGRVVGRWQLLRGAESARITVHLFDALPTRAATELEREAEDIAAFLGMPTTLERAPGTATAGS